TVQQNETENKSLWLFGRGLSYRQSFANRLFVDILYSYLQLPENADDTQVKLKLAAMGDELFSHRKDEVVPYLAAMLGVKLESRTDTDIPRNDPQTLQRRIFVAMGEWVEALITRQPLVLVFEDLHWADTSSVQLIEFLFTLTVYNPILIICVTRLERGTAFWEIKSSTADELSERYKEMVLWPLTAEESRQVIRHLLKIDPMPEEVENLFLNRAEGNPLFLEEVIRSLIEEGAIERVDDHWAITRPVTEIEIPNTLQGVLTARIDRLEEQVRRVLQIAAVIGRVFPHFILEPIVNEPEVLEKALKQLENADLISVRENDDSEYMFKHILTHETAYSSLLHQQKQLIHKQIGDYLSRQYWLLGEEYAPKVAEHYEKSETWDRALRYYQRAAVAAIQSFANQEATNFYTDALRIVDIIGSRVDQKTVLEIYEGRAKINTRLGELQEAMADYEAMLTKAEELNDVPAQMRALNGNGALQASHHNFTLASEYFQKALGVARQVGDERGIADTLNQLGNFHYQMGELTAATAYYREASELSTKVEYDAAYLTAEDGLAKVMLEQGEIKASLERYEEDIIPLCQRLGYRNGLMNSLYSVLMGQVFTADYRKAQNTGQELVELHKKSGDFYRIPLIKYYQGLAFLYQGYIDEAQETLEEGLKLAKEQEQKSSIALGLAWMGYSDLTVGLAEQGLRQAEQSVQLAHELGSPLYVMKSQAILGTAYRHLDRLNEAVIELENVQVNAHNMGFTSDEVMILYQLVRTYIDTNAWDKAQSCLNNLLNLARVSEMKEFIARGLWLQAIIETHHQRFDAALEALAQAAAMAKETASRLTHYAVCIQQAYVYQCAGNASAARSAVAQAQTIEKKLLKHIESEETRQTFLTSSHAHKLHEIADALAVTPAS
ncbi:MAG: tetratricopeptide repeat protein, partial [Anaerolineae bacterium]|nr:tetratricopeptide repeat protein [Anaerolineae bacterium]